ncbi:MAG: shikimate dehydrogenase [Deltaproteobacteria bacterium]|nr:shikimate dehydrogenase [Deltaproteobacteria bacterium]MBK8239231.1 shikimate dehydrogenase [Deltaproteobacteria bacterium]MBK8719694.1 shikimate dehydrogenase [Deltaproteobacteria bacterium]MBP7288693.1 shikimate dehydrogenase [Nannocystaceae bacterium]
MSEPVNDPGRCFGVFGDPIGHSRSPDMHNAAFAAMGMPHRYFAFQVRPHALANALAGARAMGLGGLNLTVPHKRTAVAHMDRLAPEAARIGAINTVIIRRGELVGHNTDGSGFLDALAELGGNSPKRAVVLGGGGAARSVVDALRHCEAPADVVWVSREAGRLPVLDGVARCGYDGIATAFDGCELLVNATTVGMRGGPDRFAKPLPLDRLGRGARVVDLVYPRPNGGLLDDAARLGARTQDGLATLLWQGVRALELWLGIALPASVVATMRRALNR